MNSANEGPYDDAIQQELLPQVETRFRVLREPWARILTGGSTGGWIATAQQVFHPQFYGGTFAMCPDSLDFRHHQGGERLRRRQRLLARQGLDEGGTRRHAPARWQRRCDDEGRELVRTGHGDHSRSGGQWDIWEAAFGPVGKDGYPQRIWDKRSGVIDHTVAAYWKSHFDLRYLVESKWPTLGPWLADKLHFYVGDADTYNLNMGVREMDDFFRRAKRPAFAGTITYQPMAPHCWGPQGKDLFDAIDRQIRLHAPSSADSASWHY